MIRITTLVGARPQFVKAAIVSRALAHERVFEERVVHSGQHYDKMMSDVFFEELGMPVPARNLGVGSGSHASQTARTLELFAADLENTKPDIVLLYGDTNTTLAGALAAVKLHIPVAHVEAGFRCFDRAVPEEVNRVITDAVSTWLFAPTPTTRLNLERESLTGKILQVGDVMYDAALYYAEAAAASTGARAVDAETPFVLATIHRPPHTDDPVVLTNILRGLVEVGKRYRVILPLHPRTSAQVDALGWHRDSLSSANVDLTGPVSYLHSLALTRQASAVITDSGGIQREAYFFRKPCISIRAFPGEPEWPELVNAGWTHFVNPTSPSAINDAVARAIGSTPSSSPDTFGDGAASARIAAALR